MGKRSKPRTQIGPESPRVSDCPAATVFRNLPQCFTDWTIHYREHQSPQTSKTGNVAQRLKLSTALKQGSAEPGDHWICVGFESQLLQPISQVSGHFVEILKSDEANGARIKKYQNHTPSIIRRFSDNVSFLEIKGLNEINTSQRYTHH